MRIPSDLPVRFFSRTFVFVVSALAIANAAIAQTPGADLEQLFQVHGLPVSD